MCLVFGDDTEDREERWFLSRNLFEFGFDHYEELAAQAEAAAAAMNPEPDIEEAERNGSGRGLWLVLGIVSAAAALVVLFLLYSRLQNIRRHQQRMKKEVCRPVGSIMGPPQCWDWSSSFFALSWYFP